MFPNEICETDAFLDLPATARLLYYDLSVRADGNGVVKCPRAVARVTGASMGDMEVLLLRGFLRYSKDGFQVRR